MKLPHLYYPPQTLGWYLNAPIFNQINLGQYPVSHFVQCMKKFIGGSGEGKHAFTKGTPVPETCALTFYGLNHGMAEIMARFPREEKLPPEVDEFVRNYVSWTTAESVRAYYYLFLIVTREFRHGNKSGSNLSPWPGMPAFYESVKHSGSDGALGALLNHPPSGTTVSEYLEAIEWAFVNLGYPGGYGGKPWSQITTCAKRFAIGETSAEVMLDTIWTLSHNNGPIFNKGMLYNMYSKTQIMKILDVQRSGQIPQLIVEGEMSKYVDHSLKESMVWVIKTFGLTDTVDWDMVQALGALGNHTKNKKPSAPKPNKIAAIPDKVPFFKGKSMSTVGDYQITPHDKVLQVKYERVTE